MAMCTQGSKVMAEAALRAKPQSEGRCIAMHAGIKFEVCGFVPEVWLDEGRACRV